MIKALIFDFDGLMVDTEAAARDSWLDLYREHGAEFPLHEWSVVLGGSGLEFDPIAYLGERVAGPLDAAALRERRRQRKHELAGVLPLLAGVADYIAAGQRLGLRLGVASSSPRSWVVSHLDRLGITDQFMAIVTADDVERVKPDPALYLAAVAALGVRPEEAIALEDAPNGVHAAKRAGLYCVAIPNALTGQLPLDHADLRLTSLADIPLDEVVRRAEARLAARNAGAEHGRPRGDDLDHAVLKDATA